GAGIWGLAGLKFGPVWDTPTQHAMPIALVLPRRVLVARVGLTNMGRARHEVAVGVLWFVVEVIDLAIAEDRWVVDRWVSRRRVEVVGLVARPLERCTALPAPDKLGGQLIRCQSSRCRLA